jgi:hypothetical protein
MVRAAASLSVLMADQRANVVEVTLRSRFLLELDLAPFFDELGGRERIGHGTVP